MEAKDYIIKGADELFCQYGFRSVTMDDIAKHLGVSKKTIYQHYKDKNEIINLLIKERMISQNFQMNKRCDESDNAVQEIYYSLRDLDFLLATMNPMLFYDLQKYHQEAWKAFMIFKEEKILAKIIVNLERGLKEGLYREDLNINVIARLRLDQVDIIFSENKRYDTRNYSLAEIMTEITRHFLFGICNKKGIELIKKYDEESAKLKNS